MANPDTPFGLRPVRFRDGRPYNGAVSRYYVPSTDSTAIFIGDPVIVVTAASDALGVPTVTRATAGATNYMTGVMVGMVNGPGGLADVPVTRDSTIYRAASVAGYILVADDPDLMFEVQEDGVGGAMGVGAASRNVDLIIAAGSTVTGMSGAELDSNTLGTGATLQMKIMEPVLRPDNDPTLTNAKWLCMINLHTRRYTTGI